jgi:glycosyltransferase involved in cell wall biosynthesis/uncharacterized coiled-coil protein SlyX
MRAMRILHAPSNIANQAWATAQGLRTLGHDVEVWHYAPNKRGFPADRVIETDDDPALLMDVFFEALKRPFDVYHFHFARSLVLPRGGLPWFWDLPVLRSLGKKVFFTFHGTDVRLRSKHIETDPWSFYRFADVECDEERIARKMTVIRTYADKLIVAGAINLDFVPDAVYVPKAIDLDALPFVGPGSSKPPLVVHAPSSRATKGTEFVLKGIAQLEAEDVPFEFRLAEGLTHAEFMDLYRAADVVVDNLLIGDCEVSAIEAMALGKPVVTRIRDDVSRAHPDLPAVNADPDSFVEQMRAVLTSDRRRKELGELGRAFVERTHAAPVVAAQLVQLYEAPSKPVGRLFPDWVGPSTDVAKITTYEQRIQHLEVRVADLKRTLESRNRDLADLRKALEGNPVLRAVRALRPSARRKLASKKQPPKKG